MRKLAFFPEPIPAERRVPWDRLLNGDVWEVDRADMEWFRNVFHFRQESYRQASSRNLRIRSRWDKDRGKLYIQALPKDCA